MWAESKKLRGENPLIQIRGAEIKRRENYAAHILVEHAGVQL